MNKGKEIRYYLQYKGEDEFTEITKERAKEMLSGWWKEDFLNDVFDNDKAFRLYTSFIEIWTCKDGLIPQAGYYGIVG